MKKTANADEYQSMTPRLPLLDADRIRRDLDWLAGRDSDLRAALERYGYPAPRIRDPGFGTLLATVVSQQISTDAAAAIMARIHALLPELSAARLLELPAGSLREAGLSRSKVDYVEGLARSVMSGSFDPYALDALGDDDAIDAITALRGFGRWSAEIYLMFCLQRADVFPAGDLALRVALQKLKGCEESLNESAARSLVEAWSPCRSAGSLFLWHYYRGAPT